jgi:hypothetical protein
MIVRNEDYVLHLREQLSGILIERENYIMWKKSDTIGLPKTIGIDIGSKHFAVVGVRRFQDQTLPEFTHICLIGKAHIQNCTIYFLKDFFSNN